MNEQIPNKYEQQIVSEALYQLDPFNTCCVENEATDEYDYFVDEVYSDFFEYEISFKEAFISVSLTYFSVELSDSECDELFEEILKILKG